MMKTSRRDFLKSAFGAELLAATPYRFVSAELRRTTKHASRTGFVFWLALVAALSCSQPFNHDVANKLEAEGWAQMPEILARIVPPTFPERDFLITDYGAAQDGADCREAFEKAVAACAAAGGGRVVVPAGTFLSNGPIHLLSNINLHLQKGAVILFGTYPEDYTPLVKVRWEGTLCYNYSPLIYAYQQENVAITGEGTLDGQTEGAWSKWKRDNDGKNQEIEKPVLRQAGNDVTPVETRVFGNGFLDLDGDGQDDGHGDGKPHYLRPSFIQLFECKNVLIEGVTLKSSPFWNVHPTFCQNVTIRNVKVEKGTTNDDGIDPDSCTDVLIENSVINTNDDAIAIKAGRDQDAWNRPGSANIIVRNCDLTTGVNGITIGSEMSGGVENVFMLGNHIRSARHGINFKCNLDRGGQVQKVFIRDSEMEKCRDAVFIFRMDYHGYRGNNFPTKFNDFFVRDLHCREVEKVALKIVGVEAQHIKRVSLNDITIERAGTASEIRFADDILAHEVRINRQLWQPGLDESIKQENE